jgi:hypothetical protein
MPELVSWLGNASYGVAGDRSIQTIPITFRPTDISGLQMWLDASDPTSVNANPFGTVDSWFNKGDLSGNFDLSGTADVRYGFNRVNGLNVVTFQGQSYMIGNYAFTFQDRSVFMVDRRNTLDPSGVIVYLGSSLVDGMEMASAQDISGNFDYVLAQNPGTIPNLAFNTPINTLGFPELLTYQNSEFDLSGNYAGLNGVEQTLTVSLLAAYDTDISGMTYFLGNRYIDISSNPVTLENDYDLCEFLIYDSVLAPNLRTTVEDYLTVKWGVTVIAPPIPPPPPPPAPFTPTDISGLQVWLDGANVSSLSLSNTFFPVPQDEVLSWSNVGSAGGLFSLTTGTPTYTSSIVTMPSGAQLDSYFQLPYYSRSLFGVVECSGLDLAASPFLIIQNGQATDGRQVALTYDSNVPTFRFQVCQAGTNCPIDAPFTPLPSGLFLVTGVVDSNDGSNNAGYLNNGSNLNTSLDLGNQFNQSPIPYAIGSSNAGPEFRLAEFLEYDTLLSSSNVSTVTSYLNTKWSLGL